MLWRTPLLSPPPSQTGQISLIIVLIMVVLMTMGLSLAAQTTQELFLTQQTAESTRVFDAAEVGIEKALSTSLSFGGETTSGTVTNINDVDVDYLITKVHILETKLFEGVSVVSDVTGVVNGQGLRIQWSRQNDCTTEDPASLLLTIYSDVSSQTRVRYVGLAACDRGDGFTLGTTINNNGLRREYLLPLQTGDLFVRIKPLYNDTDIRVTGTYPSGTWTLPVQYYHIRSEAENQLGDETRIVEVNRTLPTAPSVFDYTLYSGTTIVK